MTYIGTFGDIDPNYRTRQLQNFGSSMGSALQLALGQADKKKREAEERRDREIARFMEMADKYPDAAMTMGESLVGRYGEQLPHLQGMVDALRERDAVRDKAKSAGEQWIGGVEAREAPLRELVANPGSWSIPMMTPTQAEARMPQIPAEVANELPFDDRLAARVWAKSQGYDFPEAPTTYDPLVHNTQSGKQLYAARTGLFNVPGSAEASEIAAGLRPGASAQLAADIRREEGERAELRIAQEDKRIELQRAKQELERQHEARMRQQAEDERTGKTDPKKAAAEVANWLVADTALLAEEWDVGLKEAANDTRDARVTPEVREAYSATAGPRPQPLLKSQANLLARKVSDALSSRGETASPARVQEEVDVIMQAYRLLIASGKSREQAISELLREKKK